ncbi:transporter substrate-binding domain-containing protein [Limosilactobacillus fermentum]
MAWKKWLKMLMVAALVVMGAVSLAGCSSSNDSSVQDIKKKGELVVGTSADYPPYEFQIVKNGKQQIVGYDVELAHLIAKNIGVKKVKFVNIAFPSLISELQNKKFDMVMAGMVWTKERAKAVSFSSTYHHGGQVLLVSKANENKYSGIRALKGATLGAQQSSEQETIGKSLSGVKLVTESSITTLSQEVKAGTLDGLILAQTSADAFVAEHPNDYAIAKNITFKISAKTSDPRVVVRKSDKALLKVVNKTIKDAKKSGELDKLFKEAQKLQYSNNQ